MPIWSRKCAYPCGNFFKLDKKKCHTLPDCLMNFHPSGCSSQSLISSWNHLWKQFNRPNFCCYSTELLSLDMCVLQGGGGDHLCSALAHYVVWPCAVRVQTHPETLRLISVFSPSDAHLPRCHGENTQMPAGSEARHDQDVYTTHSAQTNDRNVFVYSEVRSL